MRGNLELHPPNKMKSARQNRAVISQKKYCLPVGVRKLNIAGNSVNPIQIPSDGGKKVNILGIPMVIRIHGRDTGGVVSAVESHDVPGGGPPPHIHQREDETFQILEGEFAWTVGDKNFVTKKGETVFAPRGIPHTYRYLGKTPGQLMCVITPAGFERFFEEIGALTPQQQQDIPRVMEIAKKFGLEILPPKAH
jgi:mannose-6-phosphate isomerase-like protein (cupin superfamily)